MRVLTALSLALTPCADAQTQSLQALPQVTTVLDVNANGARGRLMLRHAPAASGPLSGSLLGDPISGYMQMSAGQPSQMAFVRLKAGAPAQVYVAAFDAQQSFWSGAFYALNSAHGGASNARNGFAFRAFPAQIGPCFAPNCPSDPGLPAPPPAASAPFSFAERSFWVDGAGARGPLFLRFGAAGAVSGLFHGDPIEGHYASGAGQLAFLRLRGGQPYQVFVATLAAGAPVGGDYYPLSAAAAPNPGFGLTWRDEAVETFSTRLQNADSGQCLDPASPNTGMQIAPCAGIEPWTLFRVRAPGAASAAFYALASPVVGRCIGAADLSTAPFGLPRTVFLMTCADTPGQRFRAFVTYFSGGQRVYADVNTINDLLNSPQLQFAHEGNLCLISRDAPDHPSAVFAWVCDGNSMNSSPGASYWEPAWWVNLR